MNGRTVLVTGGAGFLGSALVRRLVREGRRVRVLDNQVRGSVRRLQEVAERIEFVEGDVRDADAVRRAAAGMETVCHLAYINGTEYFYTQPELVLDVAVKGMVSVLDACRAERVGELILMSSSEVYQTPTLVPTPEAVPLAVPDPLNPRYSYGAGKIISEVMALTAGRAQLPRVVVLRPHNVYGPDMGTEHVIPQFILRLQALSADARDPVPFPIQGTGRETRAFVFIDDFIDGCCLAMSRGVHQGIYHVGTMEEVSIESVAHAVAGQFGRRIEIRSGAPAPGGTPRRCPDIGQLRALGYQPRVSLREGLAATVRWYREHAPHQAPLAEAGRR